MAKRLGKALIFAVAAMALTLGATISSAQQRPSAPPAAAQKQPPQAQQGKQQPPQNAQRQVRGPARPDNNSLNLLVRTTLIALNQANLTNNYSVLQDLSAPGFRAANDTARLAQIFGHLRQRRIDLSPVLFFTPKLLANPKVDAGGILRMTGYFDTRPERVNFDMMFQSFNGQWRIYGIGVNTTPAPAAVATAQPAAPQAQGAAPASQAQAAAPAARAPTPQAQAKAPTPAPQAQAAAPAAPARATTGAAAPASAAAGATTSAMVVRPTDGKAPSAPGTAAAKSPPTAKPQQARAAEHPLALPGKATDETTASAPKRAYEGDGDFFSGW